MSKSVFQCFISGQEYSIIGSPQSVDLFISGKAFPGIRSDGLTTAEIDLEIACAAQLKRSVILLDE